MIQLFGSTREFLTGRGKPGAPAPDRGTRAVPALRPPRGREPRCRRGGPASKGRHTPLV